MKILYVDILSPFGHKNYNYGILSPLSKICKIDIATRSDFLNLKKYDISVSEEFSIPDDFFPENISNKYHNKFVYKIMYRFNLYRAMLWVNNIINKNNYDLVFFSSIEITSFYFATKKIKTRYIFVDHLIADIVQQPLKRAVWKRLNKNIEPIVMEEYIKDYLVNDLKLKNKVSIVKHPLPMIDTTVFGNTKSTGNKIIFAPSGSNDEKFITHLIENFKKIKNYKVIIKSKFQSFKSENLEVFNTRISDKEYYEIMKSSDYVLLPYDTNYNYRVSGVFYEAIVLNKRCLINSNNTLKYYSEKYPKIGIQFNGYEDFFNKINESNDYDYQLDLDVIKQEYSYESIKHQLELVLNNGDMKNG